MMIPLYQLCLFEANGPWALFHLGPVNLKVWAMFIGTGGDLHPEASHRLREGIRDSEGPNG